MIKKHKHLSVMERKDWILSLFTVMLLIGPLSSEKVCLTKPVSVSFALDNTYSINEEQWKQMSHFIQGVIDTIPEDSGVSCVYVNDRREEITTFTIQEDKHHIKDELEAANWKPSGHSISAAALAQEVNEHFSSSDYKKKAEIFFLLVSDLTTLLGIPPVLLKKKIFVIVLGARIPNEFQSIPSSRDHIHLIKDTNDVTGVIDLVSKQMCKDSFFKCDVDKYMGRRSTKCESCMHVCSNVTVDQPLACTQQCPYILIPPRQYAVKITDGQVPREIYTKGKDSRKDTIISALLSSIGFVLICLNIGLVFVCRKKRLLCFASSTDVTRQDNLPVPETVGPDEQVLNVEAEPLVADQAQSASGEAAGIQGTDRLMAPRDFLKNAEEEEMNQLVFEDPMIIDLRSGHQ